MRGIMYSARPVALTVFMVSEKIFDPQTTHSITHNILKDIVITSKLISYAQILMLDFRILLKLVYICIFFNNKHSIYQLHNNYLVS